MKKKSTGINIYVTYTGIVYPLVIHSYTFYSSRFVTLYADSRCYVLKNLFANFANILCGYSLRFIRELPLNGVLL